jgi:DNA-directed RNA polymerase specialized sigma24 family protein
VSADHDDQLADQLAWFADDTLGQQGRQQLHAEVRRIARQVAQRRLGSLTMADEVENETWRKLMERVRRPGYRADPIRHGAAYVRRTAESVCADLGRGVTERRREVPAHEHESAGAEPARAEDFAFPVRGGIDVELTGRYGLVSEQLRADLRDMNPIDIQILCLRQHRELSYAEIADQVAAVPSPGAAQRRGERAIQELRGRATVVVWKQTPVGSWERPRCAILAAMQREVAALLDAGKIPKQKLYQRIGKHIAPNPNRVRGRDPACPLCRAEFEITVRTYEMLVALVPSLLDEARRRWRWQWRRIIGRRASPSARPPGTLRPPGKAVGALVGVCLLVACCVAGVRAVAAIDLEELFASPSTAPSGPTPSRSRGAARPAPATTAPALCSRLSGSEVADKLGTLPMRPCDGAPSTSVATFVAVSGRNGYVADSVGINRHAAGSDDVGDCPGVGTSGTIPGLGDDNCYHVGGGTPSVGGYVKVRKGDREISINVGMIGMTRAKLVQLARYVTGRLL